MNDDRTESEPADESAPKPLEELFENDDLDEVVMNADATGMVQAEHLITEAELREAGVLDEGNV
jgi:hypothetical protein